MLVVDLRGFTPLSARLSPPQVMALLADYQGRMVAAIRRHGGSVDKFLGDGILASFGAVRASATFAADAARAVEAVVEEAAAWAEARRADAEEPLAVGVALASGRVMFGCVGDHDRLEYTVIGEAVNLAAKLEKHGKAEAASALLPAETLALAEAQGFRPSLPWRRRAARTVAGVPGPVDLRGAAEGRGLMFESFQGRRVPVSAGIEIFCRVGGGGPPLLLLHGYPQTHAMWHRVAPELARRFTVVVRRPPRLRRQRQAAERPDARGLLQARDGAGHGRGDGGAGLRAVRGRGPRPRRAGGAPACASTTRSAWSGRALLDIVPTRTMFGATDMALAMGYYHWFFLAQPEPLPERLIGADPLFYLRWTLARWSARRVDGPFRRRGAGRI